MNLIDTHCHINFDSFDDDRSEVIKRARETGVQKMICIGCRVEDAEKAIAIAEQHENIFVAVGIHPADVSEQFADEFVRITELSTHKKVVALGETGLDFFRAENPSKKDQIESFKKHFQLAKRLHKPLIVHSRAAYQETLEVLEGFGGHPFVIHCFSEDMAFAERIFALGGMISFTGIVTFPKSEQIQEVAKNAPLEKVMVETDCPFLAPVPHRGKRCEPAFVADTARFIAGLREMGTEEFAKITTENAEQFFGI